MLFIFSTFWFEHLLIQREPYHYLRFEKGSRYYEIRLCRDLFEDWTLIISNGRIKSKLGQSRTQAFSTFNEALAQLYATVAVRHQRQYQIKRYLVEDVTYALLFLHLSSVSASNSKAKILRKKATTGISNRRQPSHKNVTSHQSCFMFQ
jgi:predicted DNA-binding WGR domain protein